MKLTSVELLSQRATHFVELGDWEAARTAWLAVLAHVPDSADVLLELSYVESFEGKYRAARDWVRDAVNAESRSAAATLTILRRLCTFNEIESMRKFAARFLADPHTSPDALIECARQLSILNESEVALQCAQAAVIKMPHDPVARLVRGQLLSHHGRLKEAEVDIDFALARNPRIATAWWMLARLRKQTRYSNHVAKLSSLLGSQGLRATDVASIARALHKELDDMGDYAGAWQALLLQCKSMRSLVAYDQADTKRLIDGLISWTPLENEMGCKPAGKIPIFIVGMHRSGTTLLEQLLDANAQVRALGELYDFTAAMRYGVDFHYKQPIEVALLERASKANFHEIGAHYLRGIEPRLGVESHFTDKQPTNFLNIGFICHALPQAKIIHMTRDPVEVCFSNLSEIFADANKHTYDQIELADYFLQYRRLMAHWHEMFPERILDVSYARLTADPESAMREVAAFCEIEYTNSMSSTGSSSRAVSTASSIQVREGVVRRDRPKWAPYAKYLQPLITALRQGGIEIPELPD